MVYSNLDQLHLDVHHAVSVRDRQIDNRQLRVTFRKGCVIPASQFKIATNTHDQSEILTNLSVEFLAMISDALL